MRLPSFGLGLLCTLSLALACGEPDKPGETVGDTSTGGTSSGGSTDAPSTGDTHASHTGSTTGGSDSGTTGDDTTKTTGDATGTTHDHTTDPTTGSTTDHGTTTGDHSTGTTHDTTTGNTDACADLDEKQCGAVATCMAIHGSPIDQQLMCLGPKTFLACDEAAVCGQALTVACQVDTKEPWLFPTTCIPDDFVPCDGKPVDQPCK